MRVRAKVALYRALANWHSTLGKRLHKLAKWSLANWLVGETTGYSLKGRDFRVGATSSAAAAGLPDWLIKVGWSSDCYQLYIRTPKQVLLSAAPHMANFFFFCCRGAAFILLKFGSTVRRFDPIRNPVIWRSLANQQLSYKKIDMCLLSGKSCLFSGNRMCSQQVI